MLTMLRAGCFSCAQARAPNDANTRRRRTEDLMNCIMRTSTDVERQYTGRLTPASPSCTVPALPRRLITVEESMMRIGSRVAIAALVVCPALCATTALVQAQQGNAALMHFSHVA